MKWLFLILLVGLLLLLVILFTKLTIIVKYFHHHDDDDLKIELRAWFGLIKYKVNIPLIKVDDDSPSIVFKGKTEMGSQKSESSQKVGKVTPQKLLTSIKNFKEILEHVIQFHTVVRKFFRKISIKQFHWSSSIGLGDAALTGVFTGAFWSIKGSMIGLLSHYFRLKTPPELAVIPYFQQMILHTEITCIFQFRIGYAIGAGMKLVKFWKGGRPHLDKNPIMSDENAKTL